MADCCSPACRKKKKRPDGKYHDQRATVKVSLPIITTVVVVELYMLDKRAVAKKKEKEHLIATIVKMREIGDTIVPSESRQTTMSPAVVRQSSYGQNSCVRVVAR